MSPAALSYMLTGKRPVSTKTAKKLMDRVSLTSAECLALTEWMTDKRKRSPLPPMQDTVPEGVNAYQITLDSFAFISDWFHYGILSLLDIPGARFEPKWVARHLGITEIEAKGAMERLARMGIIEEVAGRWKQVTGPIRIASDVPTSATKKFQKQILLKGIESIENDPDEVKDFSSMTLAMDPAQVPYAKQRIREFRRALAEELEAKGTPERVYKLTVQIFPVSRHVEKKE